MKTKKLLQTVALALACGLLTSTPVCAAPIGTAFTYQGQLTDGANPANGNYDLKFTLYDDVSGGSAVAGPLTNSAVAVTNGLFTVSLDFGSAIDGTAIWLQIGVRPNGSASDFVVLIPRQPLTPSPYALYTPIAGAAATAMTADTVTTVPLSALPASVPRLNTNLEINVTGDLTLTASTSAFTEGFEDATFPPTGWNSGGNAPWVRTSAVHSEGAASAVSGPIGDSQSSYLNLTWNQAAAGLLNFDWKVSSEPNFDFLRVWVDGVLRASISGTVDWTPVTLSVEAGTYTVSWEYVKDISVSSGQDCGWIDNVRITTTTATGSLNAEAVQVTDLQATDLYVSETAYFSNACISNRVGIGTMNPGQPLQVGDASVYGSEGLIRLAAHSTNSSAYRTWDIGVPQSGSEVSGAGYGFIIDDLLYGTGPEFLVHWGNGRVGIGRTNPVTALDVNGTVTATGFAGNAASLTNLSASQLAGTLSLAQLPSAVVTNNSAGVNLSGSFSGNGAGLTNLNASQMTVGTIPPALLPGAVVTNNATGLNLSGTFSGDGAGLTNLPSTFAWQVVAGTTVAALPNACYGANNDATQVSITLPASPDIGDIVRVSGMGAGGWKIAQNVDQSVFLASAATSPGVSWTARDSNRNWQAVASSADGSKLAAVVWGGQIYTSTDSGTNWTARDSNRYWQAVASSADGNKLVAVVYTGQIYTSTDSGVTWVARESSRSWYSVASSADGSKLVAVVLGRIYTSTNSGTNWTDRGSVFSVNCVASSADGTKLVAGSSGGNLWTSTDSGVTWTWHESGRGWAAVASSADGSKLAAAVHDGQIYTSTDSGATWIARGTSQSWVSLASSADGNKLVAAAYDGGQIYISADSGTNWIARGSNQNWGSVASSADGSKLVAVVDGGQIYTSIPTPTTTIGTAGYLTGGQFTALELQYIGNGLFMPLSHEGTISAY